MDDTFRCPKCGKLMKLPPQIALARDIAAGGGSFIGFTERDSLPCPSCGHQIPLDELTRPPPPRTAMQRFLGGVSQTAGCLLSIVVVIVLVIALGKCSSG